jgi:hypothetical protein
LFGGFLGQDFVQAQAGVVDVADQGGDVPGTMIAAQGLGFAQAFRRDIGLDESTPSSTASGRRPLVGASGPT